MKKQVGDQLCVIGVILLLTSFVWAAFDADLALAVRGLAGALIVSGLGVRGSVTPAGRILVGWLGWLVFVPALLSLPLLAFLHFSSEFRLWVSWLIFWFLGLCALCGAVFLLAARERAVGLSEQQGRVHASWALQLGRAYQAKADPLRVRSAGFFWPVVLCAEGALAVRWSGLPLGKLPGLLIASWFVIEVSAALHEIAHAVWGIILGYGVASIRIGSGPAVARFALGSVPVELGLLATHGRVNFRFGETPTWHGLRRVAWAGPVSGILPFALGTIGMFFFDRDQTAFLVSSCAVLAGLLSLGQLSPGLARVANRIGYTDGIWLFVNEAVRRQIFVLQELANLRAGRAASAEARAQLPRFVAFWEQLQRESNAPQRHRLLIALASVTSDAASSPLTESALCELFALGMLTQRALADDDLKGLEAAVDAYAEGSAPLPLKTRVLDVTAHALLSPARPAAVPLAERWARRAAELSRLKQ
ncbi:MAG: hypothetical protein ABW061_29390 [Polyangiaceae bacterium]